MIWNFCFGLASIDWILAWEASQTFLTASSAMKKYLFFIAPYWPFLAYSRYICIDACISAIIFCRFIWVNEIEPCKTRIYFKCCEGFWREWQEMMWALFWVSLVCYFENLFVQPTLKLNPCLTMRELEGSGRTAKRPQRQIFLFETPFKEFLCYWKLCTSTYDVLQVDWVEIRLGICMH